MGKKIWIRQGKKYRIKSHVYVLTETNNTSFFRVADEAEEDTRKKAGLICFC